MESTSTWQANFPTPDIQFLMSPLNEFKWSCLLTSLLRNIPQSTIDSSLALFFLNLLENWNICLCEWWTYLYGYRTDNWDTIFIKLKLSTFGLFFFPAAWVLIPFVCFFDFLMWYFGRVSLNTVYYSNFSKPILHTVMSKYYLNFTDSKYFSWFPALLIPY